MLIQNSMICDHSLCILNAGAGVSYDNDAGDSMMIVTKVRW